MDVIESVISRIESRRAENKIPCKSYKTEAAARKAAAKALENGMRYFGTDRPARHIVAYNEAWGRWVWAVDMTEYMRRKDFGGGYIGLFASDGIFCY